MRILTVVSIVICSLAAFASEFRILAETNFDNIDVRVMAVSGESGPYRFVHDFISIDFDAGQGIERYSTGLLVRNETIFFDAEKKQIRIQGYYDSAVYKTNPPYFCEDKQVGIFRIRDAGARYILEMIGDIKHSNHCE